MSLLTPSKILDSAAASTGGALSAPRRMGGNIKSLTSLRFLAAALLVFYHLGQSELAKGAPAFFGFTNSCALEQGVSFFFVLSGFILHYSYPDLSTTGDGWRFLLSRFARVWPAHIAAIVLFLMAGATFWLPQGSKWPWITVSNICLLHAWVPQARCYFSLNSPSWSISTEWFFYLAFPMLIRNWRTTWAQKLIGSAILTATIFGLCYFLYLYGTRTPIMNVYHAWIYINPCSRLFEFVLGMATAQLFMQRREKDFPSPIASVAEVVVFSLAALNLYLTPFFLGPHHASSLNPLVHWLDHASGAPLYAAVIFIFAFQRGLLSKALAVRPMVFLGEISYSVYLVHWITLQYAQVWQEQLQAMPVWASCGLYWLVVLTLASGIFAFIEKPARQLVRGWLRVQART
jgi:peptidoglycan/LPS O-acetylase OafA/YrhL